MLQQTLEENRKQKSAIEISQLRQELLSERKALTVQSVLNTVVPMLDALRAMQKAFDKRRKMLSYAPSFIQLSVL